MNLEYVKSEAGGGEGIELFKMKNLKTIMKKGNILIKYFT